MGSDPPPIVASRLQSSPLSSRLPPDSKHQSHASISFTLQSVSRLQFQGLVAMAEQKKKQPVFTKVEQLRPLAEGLNLTVKVVSSKTIMPRGRADGTQGRQMRLAECLVGDETGMIIFTARNDQVDLMKEGATIILSNAKIDMFKGSMRLAVDKSGRVEVAEPADFSVKENSNLSLIEFERVDVYV